ncbi:sensor histidine kinase [Paenibacillus sp. SYP-B4298]|uniref:sensor histidine kinase n=1 Tax=Paenibacillus sp. SYP-B4298 TaxID=2996034 RepID=UPI0022DD6AB4|nr:sensor histidine kinase [Paenibacillus sp. SYP-B4298]
MNRLSAWLRRMTEPFRRTIRSRLIFIMVCIAVIPAITVTWLAAGNTRRALEQEVIQSNLSRIAWAGEAVGSHLTQLNNLIYTLMISPAFGEYTAGEDGQSLSAQFTAQRNLINTATAIYYSSHSSLVEIELYFKEKNRLLTVSERDNIQSPPSEPAVWRELVKRNADYLIQSRPGVPEEFTLTRSLNKFENKSRFGSISLKVKWRMMDNGLDLLRSESEAGVFLLDEAGQVMYQPTSGSLPELQGLHLKQSGAGYERLPDYYLFYYQPDGWGLTVVKALPVSYIDQSVATTQKYGLIVGVVSAASAALLAALLAYTVSRPIIRLARSMRGMNWLREEEGPSPNRYDEIGLLELRFHTMSSRIREHIRNEYSINLEKQTAQLKALQAQINPHFLQNTLQLIGSMSFSKAPSDIYRIIQSLSEMFRYVIREPDELATIRMELKHLSNYMHIQGQRYSNKLSYEVEEAGEYADCLLPKLSLQPIVENAFMHGFDRKKGNWELRVQLVPNEEGLCIRITDNGLGMSAARLDEVRARVGSPSGLLWTSGSSIGLYNVAARIRLHFGGAYGLTIDSSLGAGTTVSIYIPIRKKGEAHDAEQQSFNQQQ